MDYSVKKASGGNRLNFAEELRRTLAMNRAYECTLCRRSVAVRSCKEPRDPDARIPNSELSRDFFPTGLPTICSRVSARREYTTKDTPARIMPPLSRIGARKISRHSQPRMIFLEVLLFVVAPRIKGPWRTFSPSLLNFWRILQNFQSQFLVSCKTNCLSSIFVTNHRESSLGQRNAQITEDRRHSRVVELIDENARGHKYRIHRRLVFPACNRQRESLSF